MELSKEEKKAIEDLKKLKQGIEYLNLFTEEKDEVDIKAIDIVLNLIEKQQKEIEEKTTIIMAGAEKVKRLEKEIEELKKPKYIINCKTNEITKLSNDFISKDKIRERIKELEEQKEKLKYDGDRCFADYEQFCKKLKFFKEQIGDLLEEN